MYLMFIDLLFVCVTLNLKHLLLSCDYDEDVWCVSVQKETVLFRPKKESKGGIVEAHSPLSKTLGTKCVAEFRFFSSVRQVILCIYQILYVIILYYIILRNIPSGVWGSTL